MKHPCLEEIFGLKLFSIKDTQLLLMVVIYGMILDHFWNVRFSLSQNNWGQRRPMCEKVGISENKFFPKYQLFIRFIFVFIYYGQFLPKSSLKLRFVLFKSEKVMTRQGFEISAALELSQVWKGQISISNYF